MSRIKYIVSFGAGVLLKLLGGWDIPLETLVIFMCIDYITGLCAAYRRKELCSGKGFLGIMKKSAVLFIIMLAVRIDLLMGTDYVRNAVCMVYIVNELLSITENAGIIGVPVPEQLKEAVKALRSKGGV